MKIKNLKKFDDVIVDISLGRLYNIKLSYICNYIVLNFLQRYFKNIRNKIYEMIPIISESYLTSMNEIQRNLILEHTINNCNLQKGKRHYE